MKNFKYIFMLPVAACLCLFSSCSNEDYLGGHATTEGAGTLMNVTAQISAQLNPGMTWSPNDVIGIATGYGLYDATARNREYVCQADGMTFSQASGYPIYVKGTTDIVAYYPFVGSDGAEPTITLDTRDQSQITDFLFAKAEGVTPQNGGKVNLVFDYALARLNIAITAPAGEQITSCRLTGFAQQATVDPYSLDLTLEAPEDLVISGNGTLQNVVLRLIPQTIDLESGVAANLVLVGNIRSYSIDMSELQLAHGADIQANVDVTDGVGSVEFVPVDATWNNSGIGGNVSSN
ncbi:MAG: fimbrillin family protein [Prevotella sp.]|nr:fimbrillin family protein [Prevotella sp.]